jgi:predicted nucleotide-binding protein
MEYNNMPRWRDDNRNSEECRLMSYPVLVNPTCDHLGRIKEAVDTVNHIQSYFRLSLVEAKWLPDDEREKVTVDQILKAVKRHYSGEPFIVVIQNPFNDNYFSHENRKSFIITLADWETHFAPPPLRVYLAYMFAGACTNFAGDLAEDMMRRWAHKPPIGCFFDYFEEKDEIKLGMVGANLCGDCEVKLSGMGLPDQALKSIEEMLLYVRGATIRRPRSIPSRVFIGHGGSPAWLELRTFLTEKLGLQVEEFNQEAMAGIATTERLQEMLRQSCFAFLVMTAEDVHARKKVRARENVVHEIGLFQGSLGFRKAIVLKEKSVVEFSNIHGLSHISFPKGKLDNAAKEEICKTLERERVIAPSVAQRVQAQLKKQRTAANRKQK